MKSKLYLGSQDLQTEFMVLGEDGCLSCWDIQGKTNKTTVRLKGEGKELKWLVSDELKALYRINKDYSEL